MLVLYKELKTFHHLESYIKSNQTSVICSNVAISWAIHDQNLDENIDISNKTTTNISASDFCQGVELTEYLPQFQGKCTQLQFVSSLKEQFDLYRGTYSLFSDQSSRDSYFALLCFLLCPYTVEFFENLKETVPHPQSKSTELTCLDDLLLNTHLEQGESLDQLFDFDLVETQDGKYQVFLLTAPVPTKIPAPIADTSPTEKESLDQLLSQIDLPLPTANPEPNMQTQKELADIFAKLAPPPPPDRLTLPREILEKSLGLLATMDELVHYFSSNFPNEDPLYTELLESMLSGLHTLTHTWNQLDENNTTSS